MLAAAPAEAGLVLIGVFPGNDNVDGNNSGSNNDISDEIFAYNMDTTVAELAKINVCDPMEDVDCPMNGQMPENGAVNASAFALTENGTSGSVTFDLTGSGYLLEYVVLKAGDNFALYAWEMMDPVVGMFDWNTNNLLGPQGQPQGLSHITFYGEVGEIPLPAAGWLMLAGLAGLGFSSRRKKSG
ncbi:MAG: VPLPA-CTERM sorting domain-containing protein [Parvularculaceae bacterium]